MAKTGRSPFFNNLPDFEKEAEEEKKRRNMPKAPSFSLDDMESARQTSYDKGHADGLQNAKDSIEQQTEILVQSLSPQIKALEEAEQHRHDKSIENAIIMAQTSLQYLLPSLLDKAEHVLILETLTSFFQDAIPKSELTLHVHSSVIPAITKHITTLNPNLLIEGDDTLPTAQARLEWKDGVFEFKPDIMVQDILGILEKHIPQDDETTLDESSKTPHNEDNNNEEEQDSAT